MITLQKILTYAVKHGASDIHFAVGGPPAVRIDGVIRVVQDAETLTPEHIDTFLSELMSPERKARFLERGDDDLAYSLPGVGRFRVNCLMQRSTVGIVMRYVKSKILNFAELNLPESLNRITQMQRGLVLVTGTTGSGKSTTLAAIIDKINELRRCHIVTVEDPIEYLYKNKKSIITQREVHIDTKDFYTALRAVMREDPDVILIGEMRDRETIAAALTIAETGHLAMATLHTNSTFESINRIIDVFPPEQQNQVRSQLAFCLSGVLTQQLIPRAYGRGRVLVMEIMVCTPAIKAMIRDNKVHQIYGIMQAGQKHGMQTMNQSLYQAYANKWISRDQALSRSTDPAEMLQMMGEPVGAV